MNQRIDRHHCDRREVLSRATLCAPDQDAGGQLILSYGRPGNKILVKQDGNGTTWSNLTATKAGISSGYTSIVALTRTTALQVGDHGSNWCFPAGSGLRRVGIWAKTIVLGTNLAPGAPVAVGPAVSPMPVMCLACRPTLATPHRGHRRQAYIASLAYQLKQADTFSDRIKLTRIFDVAK